MRNEIPCRVIRRLWLGLPVFAASLVFAQEKAPQKPAPAPIPNEITVRDVCAVALPRTGLGRGFQWSPDGRTVAFFKPVTEGYGLGMELDAVAADGSDRRVLLASKAINGLFPSKPTGHEGQPVAPPKEAVGLQWSPDGSGLIVFNSLSIFWLDQKSLQTKSLVTGKETISDVQLSPDGRFVAFVRGHNLWLVNAAGGVEQAITHDGNDTVRKAELDWMYPTELGTKHGYAWSPDSSRIAYMEFNLTGVASYTPPFQMAEDRLAPTIDYPTPGTKIPQVRVFTIKVEGKSKPVLMDTGAQADLYIPRLQWLPDRKRVAIQRLDRAQSQLDLLLADASTGTSKVLLTEKDPYWINLSDILYFLKDAPHFVWSSERSGNRHLYLYGFDGTLIRQITEGDWEVTSLDAVNEREQKVYFTSTEKSPLERHVYVRGLDGQGEKQLTGNSGTHTATFAPDASAFVDDFSTAIKPWTRSVYKVNEASDSAALKSAFAIDGPPPAVGIGPSYGRVNFIKVHTHDNVDLNALLIQPPGFSLGSKYPVVIYVRGGPGQQAVHDAWDGDVTMWQQLLAQHGYVVFAVDNRGTAGRGHVFEEPIHSRLSGQEIPDQLAGLQFLKTLPYVDPDRIGIWGSGYGGMLMLNAMFHPRIMSLKAGYAVAPVVNWFHYDTAFAERYLGSSISNQDGYLSSTPIDNAHSLRSPLLVAQGAADLEVHADQAMELQHELVEAHKYAEVSLYPGEGHTLDGPDACVVSYQRATDFFGKSL